MLDLPDWNSLTKDERIELIRPLVTDGQSAAQIAARFTGATRNAVLSYVHRHKLGRLQGVSQLVERKPHGNAGQPKAKSIIRRTKLPEPMVLPIPDDLPDVTDRIGLLDLGRGDCRYCNGDPLTADHSFCGQPVKEGTPWCPEHYRRVFSR